MSNGAWMMTIAIVIALAALFFLVFSMVRSIMVERTPGKSMWRQFGLGLSLMLLFFGSWVAHGIAEWQVYTDDQRQHEQPVDVGDFVSQFGESTLENWQSEFLQLFAFVVLAALYVHKGSGESKDGDERLEAALRRIEEKLGTLPPNAPTGDGDDWKLPEAPVNVT